MAKQNTLIRLREQERELRQTLIVEAARQVFGEKTYDRASMAEIAKAAGIAKSSIYTYFKSQEELYATIAYQDASTFIEELKSRIQNQSTRAVKIAIDYFLDYYIRHEAQWRMITHFALHGSAGIRSVDRLNEVGRRLMDVFEILFVNSGCTKDTRLMAHTFFSCLSGILIAFRNYPGRTEDERIAHMKRIGEKMEMLFEVCMNRPQGIN